jgi:NAD+ kinase
MSDERSVPQPRDGLMTTTPARIARVGIVARADLHTAARVLDELADWLQARGIAAVFDEQTAKLATRAHDTQSADALIAGVELIVLLGGDGTLLATADRIAMAGASVPILGVNFGSLGFLTEITLPELYEALDSAISGDAPIEERLMLNAEILENGRTLEHVRVLNDVVVTRGALSRMTDLSVSVNDRFVARFKADGLIVATATGSTAYNLSAGGPIVHPGVDALVVTPIAPHTLTNRPVVIPASWTLVIQPLAGGGHHDVYVTFDGQVGHPLSIDQTVRVTRAEQPLRLVRPTIRSYFDVLRQKLKWAER